MSDQRPVPPSEMSPEGPEHTHTVPPLVWVILALVIAVLAIGVVGGGLGMSHTDQAEATAAATE